MSFGVARGIESVTLHLLGVVNGRFFVLISKFGRRSDVHRAHIQIEMHVDDSFASAFCRVMKEKLKNAWHTAPA